MTHEDETAFLIDDRVRLARAWPSYANLALGVWLFTSAFMGPHTRDAAAASWIMGAMIAMNAFASIFAWPVRYFNVLLGAISLAWQVSAAAGQPLLLVNGAIVSGLVVVLALIPGRGERRAYA
jgi:hypothetical protein